MQLGKEGGSVAPAFEKSSHILVKPPGEMAFPAFAETSFEHNSVRPLWHASFYTASCFDVIVP
jgi:hypothetical protein